jgi:hypothetical protein
MTAGVNHAATGATIETSDYVAVHVIDDASIPVAKISGLGTLATQSGTFSGSSSGTNTGDQTNISGNAATVTTNANLSGDVSSVGNTTTIGAGKVTEAMQVLADNTTQNVSTSKHGYAPKAPNDATKFLDGTGAYSVPAGGGRPSAYGKAVVASVPTIYLPMQETQKWNLANVASVGTTPGMMVGTGGSVGNTGGPVTGETNFITLDGSTNYVTVDIPAINIMEFTFECWLKFTGGTTAIYIFGCNPRVIGVMFGVDGGGAGANGKPRILFDDSGVAFGITGPNTINDGSWHYLVCTWYSNGSTTATGDFAIYVDGSVVVPNTSNGTGGHTVPAALGGQLSIGARASGGFDAKFTGSMCHTAIYLRALSSTEVSTHYAAH